ncbi:hypothetical protein SynMITS9220_00707 [Synechococcus sp. MIT S9220]|nr:hypothetical protein SynMITS9220_00707 [Synechococcus sp. MIT S9220]
MRTLSSPKAGVPQVFLISKQTQPRQILLAIERKQRMRMRSLMPDVTKRTHGKRFELIRGGYRLV